MWIVGIIALVLFAWWWAARQRTIQRLKMQVAIRTGARAAFERWRAPDNDQIVEAIYEAAQPTPLSMAQLDALVRPGLSGIVAELEEDGTIKPRRRSSKRKPERVSVAKPAAQEDPDPDRLQNELARSVMTAAAMVTIEALLVDPEVSDDAIEEQVYEALDANLGESESPTAKNLRHGFSRKKARSWGSAVAHFYRTRAAMAVAVVADQDPQADGGEVVGFAVQQAQKSVLETPWDATEEVTVTMMRHLVRHYQAEMDASPLAPQEWWLQVQKGYDSRYG